MALIPCSPTDIGGYSECTGAVGLLRIGRIGRDPEDKLLSQSAEIYPEPFEKLTGRFRFRPRVVKLSEH